MIAEYDANYREIQSFSSAVFKIFDTMQEGWFRKIESMSYFYPQHSPICKTLHLACSRYNPAIDCAMVSVYYDQAYTTVRWLSM